MKSLIMDASNGKVKLNQSRTTLDYKNKQSGNQKLQKFYQIQIISFASLGRNGGTSVMMCECQNKLDIIMHIRMASNNTENSKSSRIDMDESPNMNEDEMAMFLNVRRSRSDESMIGRLFNQPIQAEKSRPLIISIPTPIAENNGNNNMSSFKLFRKIKKQKKKNQSDYCKNICGYITKKIIRELCSPNYSNHVKGLCSKYKCQYQQVKTFYLPKIQQVTGPSHIPSLLVADGEQDQKIKEVFKEFFEWFIKSRYLRYLLIEGKMADKKAYIKYKNYMLLAMLNQKKAQNGESNTLIKQQQDDSSQQQQSSQIKLQQQQQQDKSLPHKASKKIVKQEPQHTVASTIKSKQKK